MQMKLVTVTVILPLLQFWLEIIIHSTPYMDGMATTRGVFKAYEFFLLNNFEYSIFNEIDVHKLLSNYQY